MYSKRYITDTGRVRYLKQKTCAECKKLFNPSRVMQTYCGYKCSNIVGNRKRKQEVALTCLSCKGVFIKRPSDLKLYNSLAKKKYRYCSQACWKMETQTVSSLKKKAWLVFAVYIKNRDDWTCYTCGKYTKSSNMHAGHYISRRYNATLFDEDNVHAQCSSCNVFRHGEPHLYADRLIKDYGQEFLSNLVAKSKVIKKFTREELLGICEKYKQPAHDSSYTTGRGWL